MALLGRGVKYSPDKSNKKSGRGFPLKIVGIPNGVELVPGAITASRNQPRPVGRKPGKSLRGGKEATVISIIVTIAAVIAITVTVTIRIKRR
jgi:hypothetical protein